MGLELPNVLESRLARYVEQTDCLGVPGAEQQQVGLFHVAGRQVHFFTQDHLPLERKTQRVFAGLEVAARKRAALQRKSGGAAQKHAFLVKVYFFGEVQNFP